MADNSSGEIIGTFIVGAAIGALGALLFAPAAGSETRGRIGDWVSEGRDKAKEKLDALEAEVKRRKAELLRERHFAKQERAEYPAQEQGIEPESSINS